MIRRIDVPIISAAEWPNNRSAAGFQLVTVPFRSLLMMASSDDSTIAARWRESVSIRDSVWEVMGLYEAYPDQAPMGVESCELGVSAGGDVRARARRRRPAATRPPATSDRRRC